MTDRTASRLAWVAFGLIAALLAGGLAFSTLNLSTDTTTDWGLSEGALAADLFALAMFSFAVVGALVASRHPRNAIGWLLLAIGFVWQVTNVLTNYETYGLLTEPGAVPRPDVSLALSQWLWIPGVGLIGTFLVLLFPDGRLPSRRWRPFAWVSAASLVVASLADALGTQTFAEMGYPEVRNPFAIEGIGEGVLAAAVVSVPLCIVGSAVGMILRYRRSHGQERLQLKWFAAAVGATALLYAIAMAASMPFYLRGVLAGGRDFPGWVRLLQEIALYSFVLIPVAAGIAILKYRLYDIDVIINRTLVYAVLTALLGLTYFLGVTAISTVVGDSNVTIAATTLAVAGLFHPLRERVQTFIDRRFYRRKYDAAKTVEAFSAHLREQVDLDAMTSELLTVVSETMQPTRVSLWLRNPSEAS